MTAPRAVVIGVGNEYRRDDGVAPAVLRALTSCCPERVLLIHCDGEPTQLFDAWSAVPLAIVVDAVLCSPATPGRIHRTTLDAPLRKAVASTHGLGIPDAVQLAAVLDRAPQRLVVYAVEAADLGFGLGLSDVVERAVPEVAGAVLAELGAASSQANTAAGAGNGARFTASS